MPVKLPVPIVNAPTLLDPVVWITVTPTDPPTLTQPVIAPGEALPIAVITRFINWFHEFGIPVGGVIVNMLIDRSSVKPETPDFVRNRVAMQAEHMETIWREFDGMVRALLPLYETEVRGTAMLKRRADELFA